MFEAINSIEFLIEVPKFWNARESHLNIKVLISAFILIKKQLLSYEEITAGLRAFTLAGKESKIGERVMLDHYKIDQALRLINKVISNKKFIDIWVELWYSKLDWMTKREKTVIERNYDPSDTKYLLPHEFLFLIWNTEDRISYINKTKSGISLELNKQVIRDFDFWDRGELTSGLGNKTIRDPHIYLPYPVSFEGSASNSKCLISNNILTSWF